MVPAYTCQVLGPQHALALPNRQQHSSLSCNVPACSVCSGAVERHCKGHTTAQGEVDAGLDAEGIVNRSEGLQAGHETQRICKTQRSVSLHAL